MSPDVLGIGFRGGPFVYLSTASESCSTTDTCMMAKVSGPTPRSCSFSMECVYGVNPLIYRYLHVVQTAAMASDVQTHKSDQSGLDQSAADCSHHQRCGRSDSHLAHQSGAVTVDSFGTDPQPLCDALVGQSSRQSNQDLQFSRCQLFRFFHSFKILFYFFAKCLLAARNIIDALANHLGCVCFGENPPNACLLQLKKLFRQHRTCNHDNPNIRHPALAFDQDFKTVGTGHFQVQHCAIGSMLSDHGDCLDPIVGNSNDFAIRTRFQRRGHAMGGDGMVIRNNNRLLQNVLPVLAVLRGAFIFLVFGLYGGQVLAQDAVYPLSGPAKAADFAGYIDYYIDDDWSMTPERAIGADAAAFVPLTRKTANMGYTASRIWLRMRVKNEVQDKDDWLLYFPENFKQHFRVDVLSQAGQITRTLELERDSPFSARPIPNPEMVAPLPLPSGETATVLISLWSEGSSYITFSIETQESFADLTSYRTAKNFAFYGMMGFLIVAALVALVLLRNVLFLAYSAYAGSALSYIMHVDGVAFQYLWPNAPGFNSNASIITGAGIIIFGAIYSRMFLKTRLHHPIVDKVLLGVITVTLGMIALFYVPNPQLLKKMLIFTSLLAIVTFVLAGFVAAYKRFNEVRFYLIAWIGAVVSAALLNLNHLFGVELGQSFVYESMRATIVFDAAMMGMAILDRYVQLRKSQRAALESKLSTVRRNLDLSERLTKLTDSYGALEDDARRRNEITQETVHDLRKPLYALRLKISNLIHDESPNQEDASDIDATFSYLEDLISDQLWEPDSADDRMQETADTTLNLRQVIGSICQMFAPDAKAKALALDFECASIETSVDALAIMRILSNLVSNAVNYTQSGHVLVKAKERGEMISVTVSDSGPGLSPEEFRQALARKTRLKDKSGHVEGSGIGLTIASELARAHGLKLHLLESSSKGSTIELCIPAQQR